MKKYYLLILLTVTSIEEGFSQNNTDRKFGALIEFGALRSASNSIYSAPGANRLRISGHKNLDNVSIGVGFGLDGYSYYNTAPLFLDIRLTKYNKFTPFICLGNAMKLGPLFESGPMVNVGIATNLLPNKQWLKASVSYNYQKLNTAVFDQIDVTQSSAAFGLIFSPWN